MNEVRVKRTDLLEKVKANRDAHHDLFVQAQENFRKRATEEIETMLDAAKRGGPLRLNVGLIAPEDHTEEYDRAIAMLEMSQDETLRIDASTFAQLVRNEWRWFQHASAVNSTYASGGKLDAPR